MLSHYPLFRRGAAPGLVHKLGGLPWGLPVERWPICASCGQPMSHLGQFPARSSQADAPVLPLAEDAVLFLFKCESDNICSFWDYEDGANRVFTVSRAELGDAPTPPHAPEGAPRLLPELEVARWRVRDDGAPAELEADFYDYHRHNALPEDIAHPQGWESDARTKFGGVPCWTANGAQAQPNIPPGRLLLEIDSWVTMEDGSDSPEVANFCSDGTAFVFIDRTQSPPVFSMIINR